MRLLKFDGGDGLQCKIMWLFKIDEISFVDCFVQQYVIIVIMKCCGELGYDLDNFDRIKCGWYVVKVLLSCCFGELENVFVRWFMESE